MIAPDERLCYSDECGEPCQSWQAMKRDEIERLRRENATIAQRLGEARAALAARPAPTMNAGPLRVEYGLVWDDLGSADTFPTLEQARSAARGLDEPPQVVRIETWPVADEERAEA